MIRGAKLRRPAFFLICLALLTPGHAQQPGLDSLSVGPTTSAPSATNGASPGQLRPEDVESLLREGIILMGQGKLDDAMKKANIAIQGAPQNPETYGLRGNIYAEKKLWAQAEKDYQMVLQIQPSNTTAEFNLVELKFRQKQYDPARAGFVELEKDADLSDLATYKVFLCDLFGGHEDVAAKEYDVFNQVGGNASYYFANVAWFLFHHQTEQGRDWLNSAVRIYSKTKVSLYAASLKDLGYLPLPPPPS